MSIIKISGKTSREAAISKLNVMFNNLTEMHRTLPGFTVQRVGAKHKGAESSMAATKMNIVAAKTVPSATRTANYSPKFPQSCRHCSMKATDSL